MNNQPNAVTIQRYLDLKYKFHRKGISVGPSATYLGILLVDAAYEKSGGWMPVRFIPTTCAESTVKAHIRTLERQGFVEYSRGFVRIVDVANNRIIEN